MTLIAHLSTIAQTALTVLDTEEEAVDPALSAGFADSFWPVLVLAIAIFLLGWDLMRRLRRAKNRTEIREQLDAEVAEMEAAKESASGEANIETAADEDDSEPGGAPRA